MLQQFLNYLLLLLFSFGAVVSMAQPKPSTNRPPRQIVGTVLDHTSKLPIPYATVSIKDKQTGKLVTGTTTDDLGKFQLTTAQPNVSAFFTFIGYQSDSIMDLTFEKGRANLGKIYLRENVQNLKAVTVQGEVSTTEFKLDKRVFNVGKDLSTSGASAIEVLNNVPSVNVNIEGEISLRGNTGVQILIDGKPSVLSDDPANALGTITADMIERIEVITNPSAKYEAEGSSGILNIILKKEEKKGTNGSVSVNTGIPANHSVGLSLNHRTKKFNLFTQMGAGYRSMPQFEEAINRNLSTGEEVLSEGTNFRNENFYNIRLGTDYYINKLNVITLSGSFAYEIEDQPSRIDFQFLDTNGTSVSEWFRDEKTSAINPKWQYDLQYQKEFKNNEDHTLQISGQGGYFGKDLSSEFSTTTTEGVTVGFDQLTRTKFERSDYTFKIDYTNPISALFTIETGGQYEINQVSNDFQVSDLVGGVYVIDSNFTNNFEWNQNVLGVYATTAYQAEKFGVKIGLRAENTDLKTVLTTTDERNSQNYTNLFPSAHTSYKFSRFFSMQAGYSRRIFRPSLWHLNPFFNIRNNFNVRTGNPNLQPQFTDAYEVTAIWIKKKLTLNGSIFHNFTTQLIERVTTFENNVTLTTPYNVGSNASTGIEANAKYRLNKKITLTSDANFNYFNKKGTFETQVFDFAGQRWSSRLTSKFKLPKKFDLELTGRYSSGFETFQGQVSGFAHMDLGIRKKMLDNKLIINLGVRDVFASRIQENVVEQADFYNYSFRQRGRFITLGLSYGFGKGEAMQYSGRRR